MDKKQRKEIKKLFIKEQDEKDRIKLMNSHPIIKDIFIWNDEIKNIAQITPEMVSKWNDNELGNKVCNFVFNQFKEAKIKLRKQYTIDKELEILNELPGLMKAFFTISLFEDDVLVNGKLWNYFYQSGAMYA